MSVQDHRNSAPARPIPSRGSSGSAFGQLLAGATIVFAIVIYVMFLTQALAFRSRPFLGALTTYTAAVNASQGTSPATWTGLEAGLMRQDHLVEVDGEPLVEVSSAYHEASQRLQSILADRQVGDVVALRFERRDAFEPLPDGACTPTSTGLHLCELNVTLMSLPDGDFFAYFLLPFLSGVLILVMGGGVFWLRREYLHGQLAAGISASSAIFIAGLFDVSSTHALIPVWIGAAALLTALMITITLLLPLRLAATYSRPWLLWLPMLVNGAVALLLLTRYFAPASAWDTGTTQFAAWQAMLGMLLALGIMLFVQRKRAATSTAHDQANSMVIGLTLIVIPAIIWAVNNLILSATVTNTVVPIEILMPLAIFPNAAIAYAVLQYRRFDTDRILSQGITYSVMIGALIIAVFLVTLGGSLLARELVDASNPLVIAVILFTMVLLFTPFRNRLQERIDAIYFRTRRNYQEQAEELSRKLANTSDYGDVVRLYQRTLNETLKPQSVFIFLNQGDQSEYAAYPEKTTDIRFGSNSVLRTALSREPVLILRADQPYPQELWPERSRLAILRAAMIAPLTGTTQSLNGFVILGEPRGEKQEYSYEEARFFINVTGQLAIATERAQVIQSLERRVRELDVLSQVGQAVNFTIEFDDLLELVNAQSSKLIDAPCFYIVLHEETIDMLYFAFFLEDDDRVSENENRRWRMGDDVFSEIIRMGRPIRLDNYGAELARRGVQQHLETSTLRAWMGVPLSSGTRTLGVMAVGKKNLGDTFSDDQFKIFSDIAALAATSIDKARLFSETKIRERQLTVLNDITRQLVATESDVERLLELILSSAVEILNAEAGSLLLATEDGSGDLEFSVVIGGAGSDLVGRRVKAGQGIVGEVARSAKPLIVNDASQDPRHAQSFDRPGEGIRAQSLLTVPLITKDVVIGVLQIMNKKDGTIFVPRDRDLLTTFAGQASVAFENARLLRMTDLQLAERVRELEILERIDAELNRTLDLREVAQITVRSALNMLKAQAGALGIVRENPPYLEIVAIEGYSPEEYPRKADGLYWPLDEGIIRRVIRTRQADLATDVKIDPDYAGGLVSSLSQITIPMLSGDEINAILIVEKNEMPRFGLADWAFAQRISEHASIAIANAQLYAALTRANKSKSEFMGFAAHELKNPLSNVKGYADVLLQGMSGDLSDQQKSFVGIISANANRMQTIINDLRDSAQMDADEFRVDLAPIQLRHAIVETLRPFTHLFQEKNQTLQNEVAEDLPMILGDETRLIQVFTNLVSNAHKYSPQSTTITIDAEVQQNFVDKHGKKRGPMMVISVKDEGMGISKEDQARLFREKYFRSTNPAALEQPGTGLGMMLTQGIIFKHNGEIWIESELEQGSTFFVALPLAPQPEPASD